MQRLHLLLQEQISIMEPITEEHDVDVKAATPVQQSYLDISAQGIASGLQSCHHAEASVMNASQSFCTLSSSRQLCRKTHLHWIILQNQRAAFVA